MKKYLYIYHMGIKGLLMRLFMVIRVRIMHDSFKNKTIRPRYGTDTENKKITR